MAANTWSANTVRSREGPPEVQKAPHAPAIPFGVMTGEPRPFSRTSSAAVLAAALAGALALAQPALAGPVDVLRQGLFHHREGREAGPPVARYITEDGDVFTLDRTQPKALLKFDSSFEVWALTPQQAPRGDTIYKNDLGEPVLRATRLGGVTVFT